MRKRLAKELRPLLLPAGVAAAAAIAPLGLAKCGASTVHEVWAFFVGLLFFVFLGSAAIIGAVPFGGEFQHRTLYLVLSQPLTRRRLWTEKVLALVIMLIALHLVQLGANTLLGWSMLRWQITPREEVLVAMFLIVTLCSAGFWTLIARSTIGGVAFTICGQFLVALVLGWIWSRARGVPQGFESPPLALFLIAGLVYAPLLLWLGWRKFAHLELSDQFFGGSESNLSSRIARGLSFSWLRCRTRACTANLVRKELRLQRPVFKVAGVLSLCWFVALAFCFFESRQADFFETAFSLLTACYVILVPLLAGGVCMTEEKVLELNLWHLTLPVSARRQWLVKLAVGAGLSIVMGLVLPALLALLTSIKQDVGLVQFWRENHGWDDLVAATSILFVPFLLSFWAGTMLSNTVRAVLAGVAGAVMLFFIGTVGGMFALQMGGIETILFKWLIAELQTSPPMVWSNVTVLGTLLFSAAGLWLVLRQSLAQFRREQVQARKVIASCAVLAVFTFFGIFWVIDISISPQKAQNSLRQDVATALCSLPRRELYSDRPQRVTPKQLEQTGNLSFSARRWLRDSTISIMVVEVRGGPSAAALAKRGRWCTAVIYFSNGEQDFVQPYPVPYYPLKK